MYVANPTPPPEGLGIWGQVAMVAGTLVGSWIASDKGEDVPNDIYYPEAKLGISYCPGPWDVQRVRAAIQILPAVSPLHGAISRYFVSGVSQRDADKWARYGLPRTPLEQAGALVAEAHGGSDCQGGEESTAASSLIGQIIAAADEERATAAGKARGAVQTVTGLFQPAAGGASPLATPLLWGAVGLAAVLLLRR